MTFLIFPLFLWCTEPNTLQLEQAVDLALLSNPSLQAAYERRAEVENGVKEARANAFPTVTLTGSYQRSRSPALLNNKDFEDFVSQFPDGSFNPQAQPIHRTALDVHQPLFTWGRIRSAIQLAGVIRDLTEAEIRLAELDTALSVASAFYALAIADERVQLQESELDLRRTAHDLVLARFDLGEATYLEKLRSESALVEIEPALERARNDVTLAQRALVRVLGKDAPGSLVCDMTSQTLEPPPNLDTLMRLARQKRPELIASQLQQRSLEKQSKIEAAGGKPQLDFNGSYGREALYLENIDNPDFDNWYFTVEMSWSLFDGGARKARVAQLRSQQAQTNFQHQDLLRMVEFEVEQNWALYTSTLTELRAATRHLDAAEEAERVAKASYQEGVALQADWLGAQQEARRSRLNVLDTRLRAYQAAAQLARSVGLLPHESLEMSPQEPNP